MQSNRHLKSPWKSTMSDDNFNTPCENQDHAPLFLANRGRLLDIDGNYSLSWSPDSADCNFNLRERGDCSSPDINTLSSSGPVMEPSNCLTQRRLSTILENTFSTSSDNGSIYLWDDTFSLLGNQDSDERRSSAVESPDSVGMSSSATSCRGSMDLSFSSGEMVVRSNSSILEELAVPVVLSSLEESPGPPVMSHMESRSLLNPMVKQEGAGGHAFLGMTFVLGDKMELPCEEEVPMVNSSLALPDESDVVHNIFLCTYSPDDCANEAEMNDSDISRMPVQVIFDTPVCAVQDKDIHSSLQNLESNNLTSGNNSGSVGMRLCRAMCEGSVDLSCSSGEMVVRSNSFILEEQAVPLVLSSLEESPVPPVSSHTESRFLTPMCENEGAVDHAGSHPCFGMTFVQGDNIELPSEENVAICNSSTLPDEKASLRATFLCENSPTDCANEALLIHSEILNETYSPETPVQAITFDTPLCAVQDEDICTSTPLQNIGSIMPSLPSFAISPCTENTGSPALQPLLRRNPVTPTQFEKGTSVSGNKVTKSEISKRPKSDLSGVKCKKDAASASVLLNKPSQLNNKQEGPKVGSFRPSHTRSINSSASPISRAVHNSRRHNSGANKDQINLPKSPTNSEETQNKSKILAHTPAVHCSAAFPDAEEGTSSQTSTDPKAHIANATFCYPKKYPQKSDKTVPKPTAKNAMTDKIKKVKLDSPVGHDKLASEAPNSCPGSSSESVSRLLKMAMPQKLSTSFPLSKSKTENHKSQSKPAASQDNSSPSRARGAMEVLETNCRKVKKIGLVAGSKISTSACSTDTNVRVCGYPSPNQTGRASTSKASAASPMSCQSPTTPLNKQRLGISARESCRTPAAMGTPLSKQRSTGNQKAAGEKSLAATPASRTKPTSSHHPQTTPRSSLMGPPLTPVPRLQQRKVAVASRNQNEPTAHSKTSDSARTTQVSAVAVRRQMPFKVPLLKPRLPTTPAKTTAPVLVAPGKPVPTTRGLPGGPISPPKRTTTARLIRLSAPVDKSRSKPGARPQQQHCERGTSRPQQGTGAAQDVGPAGVTEARIQHLQAQLSQSDNRFVAFTLVLQQTLAQRDEAVQQTRGLSQELLELRGELMHTVNRSEGLAQEKETLKASLQEALEQVQAQHQRDLLELEQRLREQHQNETSAAQQRLQEETERSREMLQLQMEELRAAHETMKQNLETSRSQQLKSVRQEHQRSLQELRDVHTKELLSLNKTLKDLEMVLNERIRELTQENAALTERLAAEENKNRDMLQKDSHTVYLERELESLNVVLDLKTEQLRQQEKKLMEVDKMTEKNLKLEESLQKVQQENEDLKARMDRHTALSRQLSTEQALLQESLQKESKVNKRLSMENEELLWKLHNGDLSSPRKSSPNPPSPHFSLHSPRAPSLFSSPPVSPR